ncbi:YqcC family protein [Cronobacter turicensis]|nr:YqcC family protein [Cronobacter turicensis]ELY4129803.1 YqcC family protein [Cronobacter turicensis]ELY4349659.1 YqcC family protein [Cronobacter turicensis]ELY6278809.1 YqcC family protein [Cronobacter turicensis]
MERHQRIRQQLQRVEQVLRHHQQWQIAAPDSSAFESTQPFCMDTLEPYEWLQWVLIPRLHALLDAGAPLPQAFAVAPYYEVALEAGHPARDAVLVTLVELDALFAGDAA